MKKPQCPMHRAMTCAVAIECEHGYDVCPKCDPCTCGQCLSVPATPEPKRPTFEEWFQSLDKLGQKARCFDAPDVRFLCPGSKARRPYKGTDGLAFECYEMGLTPEQALSEMLVEQDSYL